jgi:protein translocase SEC61 complex gamma subunit
MKHITIKECVRVFKITKKPTKYEFKRIALITGSLCFIIGFIGFVIQIAYTAIIALW